MNRAAAYAANAPLMGVPGAAAPPGGVGEWFRGAGGLRLRAALWTPSPLVAPKPRGRRYGPVIGGLVRLLRQSRRLPALEAESARADEC